MKIDGGCHCGAITYEAEIDPNSVAVCHCTDCQTLSGVSLSRCGPGQERRVQVAYRRAEDLREDWRKRQKARLVILLELRYANLFGSCCGSADVLDPPGHRAAAR